MPVDAYELDTESGLSVTVWTYGATLVEVRVPDRSGRIRNVVLRHASLAEYEHRPGNSYLGPTMGRFCRNIARGRLTLDGVTYQLDLNDGRHHIHGGTYGFDRFVWHAEVQEHPGELALHLRLTSPDGDQGYPGELAAATTYRVDAAGRLTLEHTATTRAPTAVGFTNHAYWNLAGGGQIGDHELRLSACRMLTLDGDGLPVTGPPGAVTGTLFDFTRRRRIAGQGIDNFFALDDASWAAELCDPASGRRMRIVTDQPGMGIHSADWLTHPGAGICLQASAWPDAPNRPDFPSARLDPGNIYKSRTIHEFFVS